MQVIRSMTPYLGFGRAFAAALPLELLFVDGVRCECEWACMRSIVCVARTDYLPPGLHVLGHGFETRGGVPFACMYVSVCECVYVCVRACVRLRVRGCACACMSMLLFMIVDTCVVV